MPLAYVAWRAGTTCRVVVPVRQDGNRFLVSLKGLQIRAQLYLSLPHLRYYNNKYPHADCNTFTIIPVIYKYILQNIGAHTNFSNGIRNVEVRMIQALSKFTTYVTRRSGLVLKHTLYPSQCLNLHVRIIHRYILKLAYRYRTFFMKNPLVSKAALYNIKYSICIHTFIHVDNII